MSLNISLIDRTTSTLTDGSIDAIEGRVFGHPTGCRSIQFAAYLGYDDMTENITYKYLYVCACITCDAYNKSPVLCVQIFYEPLATKEDLLSGLRVKLIGNRHVFRLALKCNNASAS